MEVGLIGERAAPEGQCKAESSLVSKMLPKPSPPRR
jgi:hypothetical protein